MNIRLISERALDTMNISSIRECPSRGKLGPHREYTSSNGHKIRIARAKIDDHYVDITQSDLDVLRAINAIYVEQEVRLKWISEDPDHLVDTCSGVESVTNEEAMELAIEGNAKVVEILRSDLRRRLACARGDIEIQDSLEKLSRIRVTGEYTSRHGRKAKTVKLDNAQLLSIERTGTGRDIVYYIFFATKWGLLYLHNIRTGNITWPPLDHYKQLGGLEKSVLYTVLAYPNQVTRRTWKNLVSIFDIRVGHDKERATTQLHKALDKLQSIGYVSWSVRNGTYEILRQVEGLSREDRVASEDSPSTDATNVANSDSQIRHSSMSEARRISATEFRVGDCQEEIQSESIQGYGGFGEIRDSIQKFADKLSRYGTIMQADPDFKEQMLCRHIYDYSPLYLWTQPVVHEHLRASGERYPAVEDKFEEIQADVHLQTRITEYVKRLEAEYGIPITS